MFKDVSFAYPNRKIFEAVSFELVANSMTAVVGSNGAGKSTFLKLLTKELIPQKGTITIAKEIRISYLAQLQVYDKSYPLSVYDVASMGQKKKNEDLVNSALHVLGLMDFKDQPISNLSGGQFQRMLFARSLVLNGDLFLLDEPFTAVDEKTIQDLLDCMKQVSRNKTILCVCHDLDLVCSHFSYILHIKDKKITLYTQEQWNHFFKNNGGRLAL